MECEVREKSQNTKDKRTGEPAPALGQKSELKSKEERMEVKSRKDKDAWQTKGCSCTKGGDEVGVSQIVKLE